MKGRLAGQGASNNDDDEEAVNSPPILRLVVGETQLHLTGESSPPQPDRPPRLCKNVSKAGICSHEVTVLTDTTS